MELAIPLAALTGLYVTSRHNNENKIECENFENYHENNNIDEEEREKQDTHENGNGEKEYIHANFNKDKYFNGSAQEVFQQLQNQSNKPNYSLTGDVIDSNNFKHNNMKPYFGGKIRGVGTDMNVSENILDNKIGSGSQSIRKQEQAPLFKPMENVNFLMEHQIQVNFIFHV